jgi:GAF domain-containing protein
LSAEPTLIPDLTQHEKWKSHPSLQNEDRWLGYAGFPVINKDNYALGTFCLLNREPLALNDKQITLLKGICERIAHQIDTQTEQKEITAETVQIALKSFRAVTNLEETAELNDFLSLCSGKRISKTSFSKLVEFDLATYEDGEMVLSEAGRSLLRKMKLQPKVMKKSIIKTQNKPTFLDELLGEL